MSYVRRMTIPEQISYLKKTRPNLTQSELDLEIEKLVKKEKDWVAEQDREVK